MKPIRLEEKEPVIELCIFLPTVEMEELKKIAKEQAAQIKRHVGVSELVRCALREQFPRLKERKK